MAVTFTPDQQKVIDTRNKNILVSAAAGSGKTAVLVERIIQRVLDAENPIDIDKMLVVTFTNAAAAGMKEKISAAIQDKLLEEPNNVHLQRQAVLVHQAQITTIHSFCLYLIKNHFEAIGLEPDFQVADEPTMKLLSKEVIDRVLEQSFTEADEDFLFMVEFICHAGRESILEEFITELYKRAESMPFPKTWLLERKKDYDFTDLDDFTKLECGKYLLSHFRKLLKSYEQGYQALYKVATSSDGPYMYADLLEKEREFLQQVLKKRSLKGISTLLPNMKFERLPSKKDDTVHLRKRKYVSDKRGEYKKAIQKLCEQFFIKSPQSLQIENEASKRVVSTLVDLTLSYMEVLAEEKNKRGIIDFHDMEHFALQILLRETKNGYEPTEIAKNYQQYFEEVMVDEYQDSNLVQEYIVTAVSGEDIGKHNRFMVGDVKQSIYKFRLARPEIFMEKYDKYGENADDTSVKNDCDTNIRIDLKQNFRSRKEVLEATNNVFKKVMRKELGGIAYDKNAALYVGRQFMEAPDMEAELLITTEDKPFYFSDKEWEAACVARRIKELIRTGYVVNENGDGLRPIKYGDIVLLFRAPGSFEKAYRKVFQLEEIPMFMTSSSNSFETFEIQTLMKFLQAIENPRKDIPLFGVATSLFGEITENEIAEIKIYYRDMLQKKGILPPKAESCLYEMMCLYAENVSENILTNKIKKLQEKLQKYRKKAEYLPIVEVIYDIVQEFHYREFIGLMQDGERRLANLELFIEHAATFGVGGYKGLFAFISYMSQLEKQSVEYGQINLLGQVDAVRVMTIHKSKGLEFPVVFVCGMGQSYATKGKQQMLFIDNDMGVALDYVNPKLRSKNKTIRKQVISLKMDLENLAEEQRVLYVAMTRAKEKLIMAGHKNKFESVDDYLVRGDVPPELSDILGAKSYLDLCLLSLAENSPICVKKCTSEGYTINYFKETENYRARYDEMMELRKEQAEDALLSAYEERFAFQYPFAHLKDLYAKTSVSELKKAALEEEQEAVFEVFEAQNHKEMFPYIPEFMREKREMTGAERGTAYHRLFELIDFKKPPRSVEQWKERILEFTKTGKFSERQAACINVSKMQLFMQSDIGKRMQKSACNGTLFREKSFFLGVPADTVDKKFPSEELVLVQGIIDAYFEEEDGIVLVDYKTDRVQHGQELIDRYKVQMQYYVKALEQAFNKKVKEVILYSLTLGEEVKCF